MKTLKKLLSLLLVLLMIVTTLPLNIVFAAGYEYWEETLITTDQYKDWTIKLNMPIKLDSVNSNSVFIVDGDDSELYLINVIPSNVDGIGYIKLINYEGFKAFETYTIIIKDSVMSLDGIKLKKDLRIEFRAEPFAGGTGTINNPYLVATAEHLYNVRNYLGVGIYFKQTADIDLGTSEWTYDKGWQPIGNAKYPFSGNYNGDGNKITGLYINRGDSEYNGLFGYTSTTAKLNNISLNTIKITGSDYVGGLVGYNEGTIRNSYVTGEFTTENIDVVGGLVGWNEGTIESSYSTASVKGNFNLGGLVGLNKGSIHKSYATGAVIGRMQIGGLVGLNEGSIQNSYATGMVQGIQLLGGLVGKNDQGTVSGSYYNIDTSEQSDTGKGYGMPTDQMSTKTTFTSWDFTNTWSIKTSPDASYPYLKWQTNNIPYPTSYNFAGGAGTEDDPYLVASADHLNNVRKFLSEGIYFEQTANINLDIAPWNTGEGWIPIGLGNNFFNGCYNGKGYGINGLTINRPTDRFQGLFDAIIDKGHLLNISLNNVQIKGLNGIGGLAATNHGMVENSYVTGAILSTDQDSSSGGLVGYNKGTIDKCGSMATVTGYDSIGGLVGCNVGNIIRSYAKGQVTGKNDIGGLVGINTSKYSFIELSYSTGKVTGDNNIGGLVGNNEGGATIDSCYATGNVVGISNHVGGLVGDNDAIITTSYAKGAVTGHMDIGGLVGYNTRVINNSYATGEVAGSIGLGGIAGANSRRDDRSPWGTIDNCYAIGKVNKATNKYEGGIVGYNGGFINKCYYNKDTTGRSDTNKGSPKTTLEMLKPETFINWDFTKIWSILPFPSSYPYLRWQGNINIPRL